MRVTLRSIVVLWLALGAAAVGARGQYGFFGGQDRHEVHEADIRYLVRKASLTEDQSEAALNLFNGYAAQMAVARQKMEDFQRAFFEQNGRRLSPKSEEWERAMGVYRDFNAYQQRQRERLLEDLNAVLTPEQTAGWEALQRHLRRQSTLSTSLSPIGSIDLVSLATSAAGDESLSPEAAACLDQYEIELDRALARLEAAASETEAKAADAVAEFEKLSSEEQSAMWSELSKPVFEASRVVRDINLRYADRVAAVMTGERAERFEAWFYSRIDHSHSSDSDAARAIAEARKAPGLSPEQAGAIDATESEHRRESRQIAQELIRLNIQAEDSGRNAWEFDEDDGYREALMEVHERRRAQMESCLDRLRAILTAEQLEAMPPPLKRTAIEFPTFPE